MSFRCAAKRRMTIVAVVPTRPTPISIATILFVRKACCDIVTLLMPRPGPHWPVSLRAQGQISSGVLSVHRPRGITHRIASHTGPNGLIPPLPDDRGELCCATFSQPERRLCGRGRPKSRGPPARGIERPATLRSPAGVGTAAGLLSRPVKRGRVTGNPIRFGRNLIAAARRGAGFQRSPRSRRRLSASRHSRSRVS